MPVKTTAKELLARLLKQGSSIPELREFRQQVRDVYSMGGALGVDNWIEARRDLGLLSGRLVNRAADELQLAIGRVIDEITLKPSPPKPALTWEQRVELINARETLRRNAKPKPPPHRSATYKRLSLHERQQRDVP